MPPYKSVAVIGAGSWGTALSNVASRAPGVKVVLTLYARSSWSASRHDTRATREKSSLTARRPASNPGVKITGRHGAGRSRR